MKPAHEQYAAMVRTGPSGLFSRNDTARIMDHVADGVAGAAVAAEYQPTTIIDLGSGGGVPGLQLAVELDGVAVTLVESQAWKAEFLHACARALDLDSRVRVCCMRAEETPATLGREVFDVGTARALAAPIVVAEYLAPLVRVGGWLLLWSTTSQAADPGVGACPELGLGDPQLRAAPSPLRGDGVILAWPKVSPCSLRFPRRVGVAARRPIRPAPQ